MKFQKFAEQLEKIEKTSSRLEMTDLIVDLLKSLDKKEVAEAMYLMQGRVAPRFVDIEFNVARKLMIRSLSKAFGKEEGEVKKMFSKLGDLGAVAEKYSIKAKSALLVAEVYQRLLDIAVSEGKDSQSFKVSKTANLIKSCDSRSGKFVTRMVLGNLRLGVSDKTILDALSVYSVGDKSKRKLLDNAYGVNSDIGYVAETVIEKGLKEVTKFKVTAGVPIASMLCEREATEEKILERMNHDLILQPKYDGLRCQIHYKKDGFKEEYVKKKFQNKLHKDSVEDVRIFSRNLENLTQMFPEIMADIRKLGVKSIVLDAETIAYDENTDSFLPFQETIQRRRKYNVREKAASIPVRAFVFDILEIDGKDLLHLPYEDRLKTLKKVTGNKKGVFIFTDSPRVRTSEEFTEIFEKYVEEGLEGVIAKDPKSEYFPDKRGYEWIKYKKSSKGYVVDTVDAVVLGYYSGRGGRAKFGIGALLIGIYNQKTEMFETIAKVGTGITDDQWPEFKKRLDSIVISKLPENVKIKKGLLPDVLVKPEVVVVVEADEITISTNHTAGMKDGKGYSLRFPRLKEFDRKDKDPEQVNTTKEIIEMFAMKK